MCEQMPALLIPPTRPAAAAAAGAVRGRHVCLFKSNTSLLQLDANPCALCKWSASPAAILISGACPPPYTTLIPIQVVPNPDTSFLRRMPHHRTRRPADCMGSVLLLCRHLLCVLAVRSCKKPSASALVGGEMRCKRPTRLHSFSYNRSEH